MYIAMNRFRVLPGQESAFEEVWLSRETHLDGVPGFVAFHLLRGPKGDDHTLYSSHTVWRSLRRLRGLDEVARPSAPPTRAPATTARSTPATPTSRASR